MIARIRRIGVDKETINTCYVIDNFRHLLGIVTLRKLVLSSQSALIEEIMNDNLITVHTMEDQEDVAHDFQKYDLTSMPVVDNENRLVGIITVDDIVDTCRKKQLKISKKWPQWYRQTSLILKMARLKHLKKEYRGFCY